MEGDFIEGICARESSILNIQSLKDSKLEWLWAGFHNYLFVCSSLISIRYLYRFLSFIWSFSQKQKAGGNVKGMVLQCSILYIINLWAYLV